MKNIFRFIFRGFAVLGMAVFFLSAAGWVSILFREKPTLPESIALHFDFTHDVQEKIDQNTFSMALKEEQGMALRDIVAALDLAAKDPRVKVISATFDDNTFSLAASEELRAAVLRARDAGKITYAFSSSFGELGPADKAYHLATAFEEIWLQPLGLVGITGFAIQQPFAKAALDKIGATAEFAHREEYKNMMESLSADDYSAASIEMLEDVLDAYSTTFVDDVAAARGIEPLRLFTLMDKAPLSSEEALEENLIDKIGYADELEDVILSATQGGEFTGAAHYLALRRNEIRQGNTLSKTTPVVALIQAAGNIVQQGGGPMEQTQTLISAGEMVGAIEDAVNDESVEAIVLRIDSPGGSATASETIRRSLQRAQMAGLPVVVSMGSMAASGAYWIASTADLIVANEATLTGSIGVVAGKVSAMDGLWEKLGLSWGVIARGQNADMWSPVLPFTDAQFEKVDGLVGATYDAFLNRVAEGRGMSKEEARAVAKGRVWTGGQAEERGLVDEIGGLSDAIAATKSLLGVAEDESVLMKMFPAPLTFAQRLAKTLEQLSGIGVSAMKLGVMLDGLESRFVPALQGTAFFGQRALVSDAAFLGL